MEYVNEMRPDVEVIFEFNYVRHTPVSSGYRPAHLINDDYLTSGVHHYYSDKLVYPGESSVGTISFITPEAYPHCLWIGKKIRIQEGAKVVGYATITQIFNMLLQA